MFNNKAVVILVIAVVVICFGLSGCETFIDNSIPAIRKDRVEEMRRNHHDPNLMIEKIERDRKAETADNIEKQTVKDEAAKEKQLNEIIDKQLHRLGN